MVIVLIDDLGFGVPDSFGQELLPPDIDRLEPHIHAAINEAMAAAAAELRAAARRHIRKATAKRAAPAAESTRSA